MTDPYVDDCGTLHNLLGITDSAELERAEHEYVYLRLTELGRNPLPGSYDLEHLRQFHSVIFQDVYGWAGELRTVDLAKNDELFCLARHIKSASDDVFARVSQVRADLKHRAGLDRRSARGDPWALCCTAHRGESARTQQCSRLDGATRETLPKVNARA